MQASPLRPLLSPGLPSPSVTVHGFRAQSEAPESPGWRDTPGGGQRRESLLSTLMRDMAAAAGEAEAIAAAFAADAAAAFDDSDDGDELLDEEELGLLEALDAAWGSPSSSVFSANTTATAASSSQPIAIPAATYFKDQAQRAHWEKLNKKRQWYSQQQEQERLVGKTGAKAVAQQVPRPPPKHHRQHNNNHAGHQHK